ncbi:hypothetical protein [Nocardioides kribbensis]|uniref:Heavy-metal-associated domain-containing protein n=1 Tax=Nocardioides kribbensis TaxID=305517 RepID=A0ABV1NTA4_9ACTN
MSTATKVSGFLVALAALFGLAIGAGNAVGPVGGTTSVDHDAGRSSKETDPASTPADAELPGGLMVSQDGYLFALDQPVARAGDAVPVSFTITGPDGEPVTDYDVEHEKQLHLIAVRRDFDGFQHVHPVLDDDGLWTTELALTSGQWRLFADFTATGAEALTLGADLSVPGKVTTTPDTAESRTAEVDGYTVTLDGGLSPGTDSELRLSVSRDGEEVTDLDPYLGAYGHLVALREGDLAYLHVHPDGTPGDGRTKPGPDVVFYAAVPSAGSYRLFLDFQHEGVVRTAAFTLDTGDATNPTPTTATTGEESDDDHADH